MQQKDSIIKTTHLFLNLIVDYFNNIFVAKVKLARSKIILITFNLFVGSTAVPT